MIKGFFCCRGAIFWGLLFQRELGYVCVGVLEGIIFVLGMIKSVFWP